MACVPSAMSARMSASALGQQVGGAQPAVVLVDAQEPRLDLEEADHVDDGVDRRQRASPRAGGR